MKNALLVGGGLLVVALIYLVFLSPHSDRGGGEGSEGPGAVSGKSAGAGASEQGHAGKSTRTGRSAGNGTVGYAGPVGLNEWTRTGEEGAWEFEGGVLTANKGGSIAREVAFPEQAKVSFDLQWRGRPRMRVILLSDDGESATPENCYDLLVVGPNVTLRKRWKVGEEGGSQILWQRKVDAFTKGEPVRVEILMNQGQDQFGLVVDGEVVPSIGAAQAPGDRGPGTAELGNWLQFVSEDSYLYRLSDIRVEPWDGQTPEK